MALGRYVLNATEDELLELMRIADALDSRDEDQGVLLDWLVYWAQGDLISIIDAPHAGQGTDGPATAQRVIGYFTAALSRDAT